MLRTTTWKHADGMIPHRFTPLPVLLGVLFLAGCGGTPDARSTSANEMTYHDAFPISVQGLDLISIVHQRGQDQRAQFSECHIFSSEVAGRNHMLFWGPSIINDIGAPPVARTYRNGPYLVHDLTYGTDLVVRFAQTDLLNWMVAIRSGDTIEGFLLVSSPAPKKLQGNALQDIANSAQLTHGKALHDLCASLQTASVTLQHGGFLMEAPKEQLTRK